MQNQPQSLHERAYDMLVKESIKRLRELAKRADRIREGDDEDGIALAGRLRNHVSAIEEALKDWENSLLHRKNARLNGNKEG